MTWRLLRNQQHHQGLSKKANKKMKKKQKDPAFLMYPQKFISETMFLTMEERGIYITLLCAQHQHGHLTREMFYKVCDGVEYDNIILLFKHDDKGNFYNEFLENEMERRQNYSKRQAELANRRWNNKSEDEVKDDAKDDAKASARTSKSTHTKTKTITKTSKGKDNTKGSIEDQLDLPQTLK